VFPIHVGMNRRREELGWFRNGRFVSSERRFLMFETVGAGGTPLNNSVGMKGDRTIRKGLCGDQ